MTEIRELAVTTDTALAALFKDRSRAVQKVESAEWRLRSSAGQRRSYRNGEHVWSGTLEEALNTFPANEHGYDVDLKRDQYHEAVRAVEEIDGRIDALDEVWRDHLWSRFFLVTNSNGHIHSSMRCSTCRWDTSFAWLPDLSGLTEADAVEAHGSILCSICFPSAPVEWTNGPSKASIEAKAAREAEKAAKAAAKLEKALMPDGKPLVLGNRWGESLGTVVAARNWLINALRDERWYGPNEERTENIRIVSEALIAKMGSSEIIDKARKTAEKDPK